MESNNSTLSNDALDLLRKRYFMRSLNETTWKQLVSRVAEAVADAEKTDELKAYWKDIFFDMIYKLNFVPSTPCLMNANKQNPGQLSSCFIVSVDDNIESICATDAECAKIFQKNGGVGMNITALRPGGADVETSKGYAGGPCDFMEKYDQTADIVTRNNSRKGAIKIDLNDWHPDFLRFIHIKDNLGHLKRMNISVSLSDAFMNAVLANKKWQLKFPDFSCNKALYNAEWHGDIDDWESKGYPVKIYQEINARDAYREIMQSAWSTGEPGVSFRDTMDRYNPNPHLGKVTGTNPCAEFCSLPYNSCNLGSLNLTMVPGKTPEEILLNVKPMIAKAFRFLDNMITVNHLPIGKIETVTKSLRSVGLGVMGLADLLYTLGIRYNSPEGYEFVDKLFAVIYDAAFETSKALAEEKGVYPAWEGSKWCKQGIKLRNSNFLSIAPTGSISFICGVSGGLEPNYALVYTRRTNEGDLYYLVNPLFEKELKLRGIYSEELIKKISNNNGSCKNIKEIPQDMQDIFVTAYDITPSEHVEMVAIIQKHVDLSCSKSINLPNSATVEDIMDIYVQSWQLGLKGVTVYRDGCRGDDQPLTTGSTPKDTKLAEAVEVKSLPRDRAETTYGSTVKKKVACGSLFITCNSDDEGLCEVFASTGKNGGCPSQSQATSRLISLLLRMNVEPEIIIDQLKGIRCHACIASKENLDVLSCPDAIAKALLKQHKIEELFTSKIVSAVAQEVPQEPKVEAKGRTCKICGEKLRPEGGCLVCSNGHSSCG